MDVVEVVRGVTSMLQRTLGEDYRLHPELPETPVWVCILDRHQLEQILLDLALDASDAMPTGGCVLTLRVRPGRLESGDAVVLEVQGAGTGMPPEVRETRAFEPFFTTKGQNR